MQRHEVSGKDGQREPLNFKLVIEAPAAEHELFREWLDSLSPEERAAFEAKVRARAAARALGGRRLPALRLSPPVA